MKNIFSIPNTLKRTITIVAITLLGYIIVEKTSLFLYFDRQLLLEEKYPVYYDLIKTKVTKKVNKYAISADNQNLFINSLEGYSSPNGYKVSVQQDGSITFHGINNSDNPAFISLTSPLFNIPSGNYYVSDGKASIKNEIEMRIFGINYCKGGKIEYGEPIVLSEDNSFTWNENAYDALAADILIAPHFSSENITFFPMIQSDNNHMQNYQPCLIADNSVLFDEGTYIEYNKYTLTKEQLNAMSSLDWKYYGKYIKNISPAEWSTIFFTDGTGIQFIDNNINNAIYGQLNSAGQITQTFGKIIFTDNYVYLSDYNSQNDSLLPDKLSGLGINYIDKYYSPSKVLNETTDIYSYLDLLNNPAYTIFISIRGEGVGGLNNELIQKLYTLGVKQFLEGQQKYSNLNKYYGNSYYAILNPDVSSIEKISEEELSYNGALNDGTKYQVDSIGSSSPKNPNASIIINGSEESMNRQGMNFVIYNNELHTVEDSVCFDTHGPLTCYR